MNGLQISENKADRELAKVPGGSGDDESRAPSLCNIYRSLRSLCKMASLDLTARSAAASDLTAFTVLVVAPFAVGASLAAKDRFTEDHRRFSTGLTVARVVVAFVLDLSVVHSEPPCAWVESVARRYDPPKLLCVPDKLSMPIPCQSAGGHSVWNTSCISGSACESPRPHDSTAPLPYPACVSSSGSSSAPQERWRRQRA